MSSKPSKLECSFLSFCANKNVIFTIIMKLIRFLDKKKTDKKARTDIHV